MRRNKLAQSGFTMIELLIVVAIILVVAAFAAPSINATLRGIRIGAEARSLAEAVGVAKMRAGSNFTNTRLRMNTSNNTYQLEIYTGTGTVNGTACPCWTLDTTTQGVLGNGVTYGTGGRTTSPRTPQITTVAQPAPCKDTTAPTPADIANTYCIVFNSRGVSVNYLGNPVSNAVYLTNGSVVYAVTVLSDGFIQDRRSDSNASAWVSI